MKLIGRIGFIFLSFFILSCHNLLSEPGNSGQNSDNGTVRVSGTLTFSNDIAPYIQNHLTDSRALPNLTNHQFTVLMQAHNSDNSQIIPISVSNNSFSVELSSDTWTFQTHIYYDLTTSPHVVFSSDDYCFSAEDTLTVGTTSINDFKLECELVSGTKTVSFGITVEKATNITQYALVTSGTPSGFTTINYGGNASANISKDVSFSTGLKNYIIYFEDANGNVIYTIEDKILVLKGCSNYIHVNNNEDYVDGGQIKITSDVIQKRHANKIYFVDSSVTDDSTRTGTFFDPVASIQKAVNIINSVNDASSQYEIRLKSDCTFTSNPPSTSGGYVDIKPNKNLKLKITTSDGSKKVITKTTTTTQEVPLFDIGKNNADDPDIQITLENLKFTNGNATGGGAVNTNKVSLVTISNCEFLENKGTDSGGALRLGERTGSCEISDTKFEGNSCIGTGFANGGAIYSYCTLTLNDCSFISNKTNKTNTINNYSSQGTGGAIVLDCDKVLTINGCTFQNNSSNGYGGAIYCKNGGSVAKMILNNVTTNPTIFKENYGSKGNAIYTSYPITINDNVYFLNTENTDSTLTDSQNDIYYNGSPSITINSTKTNDTAFTENAAQNGYCYFTMDWSSKNTSTKYLTIPSDSTIYKFVNVKDSSKHYFFTPEGKIAVTPYASWLVKCPDNFNTSEDYIKIASQADLESLLRIYPDVDTAASHNNIIKQIQDITLDDSFSWTPCNFTDSYDGQGYTISDLELNSDEYESLGLFSTISNNVEIKNLTLEDCSITQSCTNSSVGAIAGTLNVTNSSIQFSDCYVIDSSVSGTTNVGGLLGISKNKCKFVNCCFEGGSVALTGSATDTYIGGIIGKFYPSVSSSAINIYNCYTKTQIKNLNQANCYAGGIAGYTCVWGNVFNCFVSSLFDYPNQTYCQAILNHIYSGDASACHMECHNNFADVSSFSSSQQSKKPKKICTNLPSTKSSGNYFTQLSHESGDLIVYGNAANDNIQLYYFSDNYNTITSATQAVYSLVASLNYCSSLTNTYSSNSFNYWGYDSSDGIHFSSTAMEPPALYFPALHNGTEPEPATAPPIWVRSEDDFFYLNNWNKGNTIELKTDIDLADPGFTTNTNFEILGKDLSNPVSFILNGNDHTITYKADENNGSTAKALIGYADNITIKDLTVCAESIIFNEVYQTGAVLVANMKEGLIENCYCRLTDIDFYSTDFEGFVFGGIVGNIKHHFESETELYGSVVINNSFVEGDVYNFGNYKLNYLTYGGIVGCIEGKNTNAVTINRCINSMNELTLRPINDTAFNVGGIVGSIETSNVNILNCINNQNISINNQGNLADSDTDAQKYISGIVGLKKSKTGNVNIYNCIQKGWIEGVSEEECEIRQFHCSGCIGIDTNYATQDNNLSIDNVVIAANIGIPYSYDTYNNRWSYFMITRPTPTNSNHLYSVFPNGKNADSHQVYVFASQALGGTSDLILDDSRLVLRINNYPVRQFLNNNITSLPDLGFSYCSWTDALNWAN